MWPTFLFGLAVFFSRYLELHVQCKIICGPDQYTIVTSNGSFMNCLNCDTCHPGWGLYPTCGSIIPYPPSNIDCKSCAAGTFSDQLDTAPCLSCHTCSDHEIIAALCTNVSDRTCSETCEKGYFFASHNCQQCSYCCFDGKDEKQPECIKQGLNATGRHCSARLDKQCGPIPTTAVTTSATQMPTQRPTHLSTHQQNSTASSPVPTKHTVTTQRPTHLSTHQQNSTTSSPVPTKHTVTIIIIVLSVLFGLFLVALSRYLCKKKSLRCGRKRTECHLPDVEFNTDEANRPNQTQGNNDNYASQGPQSAANPRVQELHVQNAGYASSTSATPEVSPCVSPQHTDDELDDLPDYTVRNKRLVKRQSSRESQSNASKDGASESLLDPKEEASTDNGILQSNGNNKDSKGGGQGRPTVSRRPSLEALKRKFSLSFEKDYQPLAGEDPNELQGQIKIVQQPKSQNQTEGSRVEFTCKCKVAGKMKVLYQWFKDGTELQEQSAQCSLVLNYVKMRDFGCYRCHVMCIGDEGEDVKSDSAILEVVPCDGMRLKYLREVDLDRRDDIATYLENVTPGLGGWRQIAAKYGMDEHQIGGLAQAHVQDPGRKVMEFLHASKPDLAVYNFCKALKESKMKRFDIVRLLEDDLSIEKESA